MSYQIPSPKPLPYKCGLAAQVVYGAPIDRSFSSIYNEVNVGAPARSHIHLALIQLCRALGPSFVFVILVWVRQG